MMTANEIWNEVFLNINSNQFSLIAALADTIELEPSRKRSRTEETAKNSQVKVQKNWILIDENYHIR